MEDEFGYDLYLQYLLRQRQNAGGTTTTIERTEFGKHVDHVDTFYGNLSSEQQENYVHTAHDPSPTEIANFTDMLNDSQVEQWQQLCAEAESLGSSYTPEKALEGVDLDLANLRTMLDNGLSEDPATRAIQERTIEKLGGNEAVYDLIQDSLAPDFDISQLDPDMQARFMDVSDDQYTYNVVTFDGGSIAHISVVDPDNGFVI